MQMLSKIILNQGTFIFALMTYRHVVAAFSVAPFAIFLERGIISKLNLSVWFWLFINALTGITAAMGLYYYGLRDTTATYAINYLNLLPVVTFVLSTILRFSKIPKGFHQILQGTLATAATFCLVSRAIAKRGPIYPPMFNPLSLIFVAVLDALLLGQDITLGILLGSFLIIAGLYSFLWAKSKEFKRKNVQGEEALPTTLDKAVVISDVQLDSTNP
ncbi:hypothetical protein Patl1_05545 [Pistacia atlantica]|uniref:Uncharacterized protein n=1 Tax=Pistacia atlantica TaxID=434234 RepID=A0ACC1BP90_9ROSI|nr:hypothetical protein Patl1_05545 [Pistacia atlantica]